MRKPTGKRKTAKRVLRLPDLDYAKRTVLNTLGSPESKRAYGFAIDDFCRLVLFRAKTGVQ